MALDGVADGPFVAELIELADVMQNRCRQQQVEVEFRIVCRHHLGQPAKADHMFQQPAEIGMVHNLRRGRSEEHTSELQSRFDLVCRLLLEKKICPGTIESLYLEFRI